MERHTRGGRRVATRAEGEGLRPSVRALKLTLPQVELLAQVTLTHVITNAPLVTKQEFDFNQNNCGGNCPIAGQLEVSAVSVARILLPAPVQSGGRRAVVWLFASGAR